MLAPLQPQTTARPASPRPRHWFVLLVLFVLMQIVNAWIISEVISGGFAGWFGIPAHRSTGPVPAESTAMPVAKLATLDHVAP